MFPPLFIAVLLTVALWLDGLNERGPQIVVMACLGLAVAGTLGYRATRGAHRTGMRLWDWLWGAPLLGFGLLLIFQAVNPSHRFVPESRALISLDHFAFLPRSVDRTATVWSFFLFCGYASAFWLARIWLGDRPSRMVFIGVQTACGAAMAGVMLFQHSQGPDGALYASTGAFVGPNHYAAYANLLWPVALLWGRSIQLRDGWRASGALVSVLFYLAATVLFVSVWFTGSRMGMMVSLVMLVTWGAVELGPDGAWRRWACAAAFFIGMAGAGLVCWGCACLHSAWMVRVAGSLPANVMSRWEAYRAMVRLWGDRWFTGTGAGTFSMAFPFYQPEAVGGFFCYAHNEVLQLLTETGVVGLALGVWAVYGMVAASPQARESGAGLGFHERLGLTLALCGLALHAMVDFPLRLPALALLIAALAGTGAGGIRDRGTGERGQP